MSNFQSYQPSILPAWLQNQAGLDYAAVLGALKDQIGNAVRTAAVCGMPEVAPVDALNAIGFERQIIRGVSETDQQYASRLRQAFTAWKRAGSATGMLLQLEALYPGIPIVIVQQAAQAYYLNPDTSIANDERLVTVTLADGGWRFDDNGGLPPSQGHWNRFAILFPGPLPPTWVDVQSPPTAMTDPDINEVNNILAIGGKWRPAKALFQYVQVTVGGAGYVYDWPDTFKYNASGFTYNGGATSVVRWRTYPY